MSGAVRWTVSSVCRRDLVPSVSAEEEAWEGGFHWYLAARLWWSQAPERQLWDGHGGDARDRWERRGEDIGRLLWIRPSLTVFSCSVTLCFLTGPPWGPCLCSDVQRSGPQLARSVNIVGPCEATDGQGLRYFCEESPEVDGTCRGVQQRTLWQGNTLNIDLRKVHSSWKTDK